MLQTFSPGRYGYSHVLVSIGLIGSLWLALPAHAKQGLSSIQKAASAILVGAAEQETQNSALTTNMAAEQAQKEMEQLQLMQAMAAASQGTGQEASGQQLQLYGFADFAYTKFLLKKNSPWTTYLPNLGSFGVGNLNLYLDGKINDSLRSMVEVRFTYLPSGAPILDDSGKLGNIDTSVGDAADFGRVARWGGIEIERAYLEYVFNDWVNVRAGQFLTPYGVWNVDHGSPVVISMQRPYVIGEALLPERQTGVEFFGAYWFESVRCGYHVTISNGRGPFDQYLDLDSNLAFGGRVFASTDMVGDLTIGFSTYKGRYTNANKSVSATMNGGMFVDADVQRNILTQYDEFSWAADLRFEWQDLLFIAEMVMNEVAYTDKGRPGLSYGGSLGVKGLQFENPDVKVPDDRRFGAYSLIAYRLPFLNMRPYVVNEYYSFSKYKIVPNLTVLHAGINVQLDPAVIVKIEYGHVWFLDPPVPVYEENIRNAGVQLAWAF